MLRINRERENENRATISSASVFSRAKSRAWKRPLSFIHVRFFSSARVSASMENGLYTDLYVITNCVSHDDVPGTCKIAQKMTDSLPIVCLHAEK